MVIRHRMTTAVVGLLTLATASLLFARPVAPALIAHRPLSPAHLDLNRDPLPPGAICRAGTLHFRFGSDILEIEFGPDGRTVYTCGAIYGNSPPEKCARAWSVPDGKELRRFVGDAVVTAVAVSPNGKLVATGENGNAVRIWDASTGVEIRKATATLPAPNPYQGEGPAYVSGLRFAADSKTVLATYVQSQAAIVWDVTTGAEVRRWGDEEGFPVTISGDGGRLAIRTENAIQVVDVAKGLDLGTIHLGSEPNNPESTVSIDLNASGTILATGSEKAVRFWDVASGKELRKANVSGYAIGLAFQRDGAILAAYCQDQEEHCQIALIDVATAKPLRRLDGPIHGSRALAFAPDGKILATGGSGHTVCLWDTATGKQLPATAGHPGGVTATSLTRDGRLLATCSDHDRVIRLWDTGTGREVRRLEGHAAKVDEVTMSPDGRLLASAAWDDGVCVWDVATGRLLHRLDDDPSLGAFLRFADDGKTLATFGRGETVGLWDCATGNRIRELRAPPNGLAAFGSFHDGRLLGFEQADPTEESDSIIALWDLTANYTVRRFAGHQGMVNCAVLSPDGRMVASRGADGTIRVWEAATGGQRRQFQDPGPNPYTGRWTGTQFLAFSPDGRLLVTGASDDSVARRWDLATGKEMAALMGHRSWCGTVEFSANGRVLATGSQDTTALVWDAANLAPRRVAPTHPTNAALAGLWADLAHPDAATGYRAVNALAAAGDGATAWIADRLKPALATDPDRIALWIDALNLPQFVRRERATALLAAVADQADDALKIALRRSESAEVRQRISRVLEGARDTTPTAARLREIRAVEVLEMLATPLAREHLTVLARGAPGAYLTRDARAALQRFGE